MSSYSIFGQSKYIFLPILIEWLSMTDLGKLDSAVCNSKAREVFLDWLGGTDGITYSGLLHEKHNGSTYWQWLNNRRVHVRYMSIYFINEGRPAHRRTFWDRIYLSFCHSNKITEEKVHQVVPQLSFKVTSLYISAMEDINMRQVFPLSTRGLVSLKLTHCHLSQVWNTNDLSNFIASHFVTLQDLIIQDCGKIPDRMLADILKKSPDLVHLQLLQCNPSFPQRECLSGTFLQTWKIGCPQLQSISLCTLSYANDALFSALLPACPLLRHIMVLQCDFSNITVVLIASSCPALVSVALEPTITPIADDSILAIGESCHLLEYCNIICSASTKTFENMLRLCRKMKYLNCGGNSFRLSHDTKIPLYNGPDSKLSGWFEPYPFSLH